MFEKVWNWLTGNSNEGRLKNVKPVKLYSMTICTNCGTQNNVPLNSDPKKYFCGNCHQAKLVLLKKKKDETGLIFGTSAIGTTIGGLVGGPAGMLIGGIAGAVIGAIGMPHKKKM